MLILFLHFCMLYQCCTLFRCTFFCHLVRWCHLNYWYFILAFPRTNRIGTEKRVTNLCLQGISNTLHIPHEKIWSLNFIKSLLIDHKASNTVGTLMVFLHLDISSFLSSVQLCIKHWFSFQTSRDELSIFRPKCADSPRPENVKYNNNKTFWTVWQISRNFST